MHRPSARSLAELASTIHGDAKGGRRLRLGVYVDLDFRLDDGGTITADRAFVKFVAALPPRVDEVVFFGRLDIAPGRFHYALPAERVRFVPLPHYRRVTSIGAVVRAVPGSLRRFDAELPRLDAAWIFGPHPIAFAFAALARRRRIPVFLGVRQDYPRYIGNRLPGPLWAWAVPAAAGLDWSFRRLARSAPTVTVGQELARRYSADGNHVLATGFSLVPRADVLELEQALARPWNGERRLLSVGRLDPEKNPLLLADITAELRRRDPRWRLAIAGEGSLAAELAARVRALGQEGAVELLGYVPNGPRLRDEYRRSHAFLHVSLTEGLPQVLFEAHAAGLPVVATAVGGIESALRNGSDALLVPPANATAAAEAVARVGAEPTLRRRLIEAGLARASADTMEAQLDRIADFLRQGVAAARAARTRS